jgi:hypothetical protein
VITAGAHELGYASAAILAALLDRLITKGVISGPDAKGVLDDAAAALEGLGNIPSITGGIRVVGDVRTQLAKHRLG